MLACSHWVLIRLKNGWDWIGFFFASQVISVAWSVWERRCRARLRHYKVEPFARLPWQTAVKKKKMFAASCKNGNGATSLEWKYAAREIYFKSPREDTGGAWLWCWVQVKSVTLACSVRLSLLIFLSLSCLKFMDFLISFFFFFKEMIIVIPRSLPKTLQKLDYGTLRKHVRIKNATHSRLMEKKLSESDSLAQRSKSFPFKALSL